MGPESGHGRLLLLIGMFLAGILAGCAEEPRGPDSPIPGAGNPNAAPDSFDSTDSEEFAALVGAVGAAQTNRVTLGPGDWRLHDAAIRVDFTIFLEAGARLYVEDSFIVGASSSIDLGMRSIDPSDEAPGGQLHVVRSSLQGMRIHEGAGSKLVLREVTLRDVDFLDVLPDGRDVVLEDVVIEASGCCASVTAMRPETTVKIVKEPRAFGPQTLDVRAALRTGSDYPAVQYQADETRMMVFAMNESNRPRASLDGGLPWLDELPIDGGTSRKLMLYPTNLRLRIHDGPNVTEAVEISG